MTLQLEEGKFYRTRDGRKAGPISFRRDLPDDRDPWFASAPGFSGVNWYTHHNVHYAGDYANVSAFGQSPSDLVAEWVDEPIANAPEEPVDVKAAILDQAGKIVNGARRSAYGTPENNFERIARFWQAYFDNTGREVQITAADVSPMMRLMKEARLCETPDHYDSFVDIVGYTLTGAEVNRVKSA